MGRVSSLDVKIFVLREGKSRSALACLVGRRGNSRRCAISGSAGSAVRDLAAGKRSGKADVAKFMDRVEDTAGRELIRRAGRR